jgi:MFS transporter, DHA2 family, multidrug resistance protein
MKQSFWPALSAILVGSFMAVLDTSIVNVAIPKMMAVFGVSADDIAWVTTAYTLAMAAVIPLTGYLGNRFGYKRMYIIAFVLFTIGSLFCGFAWSNNTMIGSRIIQAVGGGLIQPVGMALLYQVVPREKIPVAMGVFGISVMVAPAVGPTLSGIIVEYLDWHLIFTINVPIGLIGILMSMSFLQETEIHKGKQHFDFLGFIYSTVMLSTFLLAVAKGESKGWTSFYIISLFAASAISAVLLVYQELTTKNPLLDLKLFKDWNFTVGNIISCFLMIGMFGVVYLIPLYSENLLGFSAMKTGILMFPQSLCSGIITLIGGGILINRFGSKPLIILGLCMTLVNGFLISKIDLNTSSGTIQLLLAIRGLGLGFCMMPAMQLPLQSIPRAQTGNASALMNVTRQVALSLGVAVLTSIFQTQGTKHAVHLAETVNAYNPVNTNFLMSQQQMYISRGFSSDQAYSMGLSSLFGLVKQYAMIHAIEDALLITNLFIFLCIPLAILLKESRVKKSKQQSDGAHAVVEM